MEEGDLDDVMDIEEISFQTPWSRQSFETELRKEGSVCKVAVAGRDVVGYLIEWIVLDEVHIANIAIHPAWMRRGIGMRLMQNCMDCCDGFSWIGLEVRRSNNAARALYRKLGFQEIGVRKQYYAQEGEDAILMAKSIQEKTV
jgi:ribosomal-protein-alanine N-acetyltransferase